MHHLIVLLIAAAPILEVRAAIPVAIAAYNFSPATAVLLSVIGGVLPVFPLLWILENFTDFFRKNKQIDQIISWVFHHTTSKSKLVEDFELLGLVIFIAIPLPGSGIWTGVVLAYLLRIKWLPTFVCAVLGTLIASLLVLAATLGVIHVRF